MPKEKVTLTLDADNLRLLRASVGRKSLSASIDAALATYVERQRHLQAVDAWLSDLERAHGPTPVETLEWAARVVDQWDATRKTARRRQAG